MYLINNPSGLVHVPRSLYFVSNSCAACVYRSPNDEESQEIFREIMADAFKSAKQRIAKNVSSTGHLGPLLDLFSFVDKPSEIPYTPRKRKARKEEPKKEQKTGLTVVTMVMKGKQKWKRKVLNHRSQPLIHSEQLCISFNRGTQREYSSKPLKHSIVKRVLVFKRWIWAYFYPL